MNLSGYILQPADISQLRRLFIRDDYDTMTVPPVAISRFNQVNKRDFVTDSDLQTIAADIINDQEEELEAAYDEKYSQRTDQGDSIVDATAKANVAEILYLLKLIDAKVKRMMADDSAYRASVLGGPGGESALRRLEDEAEAAELFVASRTGFYVSAPLERE